MSEVFRGKGFEKTPLDGAEAAQMREMLYAVSENWDNINSFSEVINGAKIAGKIIKWGGGTGFAFAIVGAFSKYQGWI